MVLENQIMENFIYKYENIKNQRENAYAKSI